MDYVTTEIKQSGVQMTFEKDISRVVADFLTEVILSLMARGVYSTRFLPDNEFVSVLKKYLYSSTDEGTVVLKKKLRGLYSFDLEKYAKINVAALIKRADLHKLDIRGTIGEYYLVASDVTINEVADLVKGGAFI